MKKTVLMMVVVALSACSQEQEAELKKSAPVPQPTIKTESLASTPATTESSMPKTQIEVQVGKKIEVTKATQPDVKIVPKNTTTKKEVQAEGIAGTEQDALAVSQEKITPVTTPSKVLAPLTQGKGEIRSEPKNPPKQGLMLKVSSGDVVAGKKVAKKCMSCHTFEQDGKKKAGPNLFAIVGKAKGIDATFKYGTYLKNIGGAWDEASLRAWLLDSKGVAKSVGKKTKMPSQKIKGKKADDLMTYLKSLK